MPVFTAPIRVGYYPLETRDSYLRRIIAINGFDPELTRQAVYEDTQGRTKDDVTTITHTNLELMGGISPGVIRSGKSKYTGFVPDPRCHQCRTIVTQRWMCIQCAKGQVVEQIPHNNNPICIKHRRWTGPGVHPAMHVRIDHPDLVRAAKTWWRGGLGTCPSNTFVVNQIIEDWALHTQPTCLDQRRQQLPTIRRLPDRLQLQILAHPEAVALMELILNSTAWMRDLFAEATQFHDISGVIDRRVAELIPEHHGHITALLTKELRPAIARYFHHYGPYYHPSHEIPIWHHDLQLPTDVLYRRDINPDAIR